MAAPETSSVQAFWIKYQLTFFRLLAHFSRLHFTYVLKLSCIHVYVKMTHLRRWLHVATNIARILAFN